MGAGSSAPGTGTGSPPDHSGTQKLRHIGTAWTKARPTWPSPPGGLVIPANGEHQGHNRHQIELHEQRAHEPEPTLVGNPR